MPRFVVDELREDLRCSVLARAAVRFACSACGTDRLVALSCKGRCLGRRMTETAQRWVRSVPPRGRFRQWLLSFPFALRVPLAFHHDRALAVVGTAARAIESSCRDRALTLGIEHCATGSITVTQRFARSAARRGTTAQAPEHAGAPDHAIGLKACVDGFDRERALTANRDTLMSENDSHSWKSSRENTE
jgi:hypothetical protein